MKDSKVTSSAGVLYNLLKRSDSGNTLLINSPSSSEWLSSGDESYCGRISRASSFPPEQNKRHSAFLKIQQRVNKLRHASLQGSFGSHHVMINRDRVTHNIQPLVREKALDEIALGHAKMMASKDQLEHSSVAHTASKVILRTGLYSVIGENISCTKVVKKKQGKRIRKIPCMEETYKKQFSTSFPDRMNILNENFQYFGIGTVTNERSDLVYICQIFMGRPTGVNANGTREQDAIGLKYSSKISEGKKQKTHLFVEIQ